MILQNLIASLYIWERRRKVRSDLGFFFLAFLSPFRPLYAFHILMNPMKKKKSRSHNIHLGVLYFFFVFSSSGGALLLQILCFIVRKRFGCFSLPVLFFIYILSVLSTFARETSVNCIHL